MWAYARRATPRTPDRRDYIRGMSDGLEVTSPAELRELLGEPADTDANKDRPCLNEFDRQFLAASPKGDPAGVAYVIDDTTIAIPERPGNRRGDGFHNILENPHVGVLFMIPGRGDTLRINGRAR